MQHRIYKLNNRLTIFGLELDDLGVAAGAFFALNGVIPAISSSRMNIIFIVIGTYLAVRAWVSVKDSVPDKFFPHLLNWLAERDSFYATPDLEPSPVVVDLNAALAAGRKEATPP
jgi:hypothetical protein